MSIDTQFIRIARAVFLAALLLLAGVNALANDSAFGDENGSIVFKHMPEISMDKEVLFISEREVRVDYLFHNTSRKDIAVQIAFPMPPMYFGSSDHDRIENFRVNAEGKEIKPARKLVILLDGRIDISEKIAKLGWREKDLVQFLEMNTYNIPKGKKPLPDSWFDKEGEPRFTLNEYFIWTQIFPAEKSVAIRHTYKPSADGGVPQYASYLLKTYGKETCMDEGARSKLKKYDGPAGVGWARLRYILMTANNWQGPIKDFTLILKKDAPSDIVSLCFDGKLRKTDALTFEFKQPDFRPQHDLSIFFGKKQGGEE